VVPRPTKRLLIDVCGLMICVAVLVFIRPVVGDPSFPLGKPHTTFSIILLYSVLSLVGIVVLRDLYLALSQGGGLIRGRSNRLTLEAPTGTWVWTETFPLQEDECLSCDARCIGAPTELVTISLALADERSIRDAPRICSEVASKEVAWEEEGFAVDSLVPTRCAHRYGLGVRVVSDQPGTVRITIEWARTIGRRGGRSA